MKASDIVQLLIIALGIPTGMYLSNYSIIQHEQLEHPTLPNSRDMDHGLLNIASETILPDITNLHLQKDAMHGWNILIETNNFTFTPKNVNHDHIPGQGHAHLYIDRSKYARIYGSYFHIDHNLTTGSEIKVTLNSNQHETLSIGTKPIEYTLKVP